MRNRLASFVLTLLGLPPLALTLAGQEWESPTPITGAVWLPSLCSLGAVLACCLLFDTLCFHRTGNSLLHSQRRYLLWNSVAGAVACMLLAYLNLFVAVCFTPLYSNSSTLLLAALCGVALLPAVLIVRLWLAGLPGMVKLTTRKLGLPAPPAEVSTMILLLAVLGGLMGGTIWTYLGWLFWLSPLLLLVALQLLWHESTVFTGLQQGDWSRVVLGAISGIIVSGTALATYRLSGGAIYLVLNTWQLIFGMSVFGWLCLQIGDVVAENWRGKKHSDVFKKKPFPIPIVTRKDQ